MSDDKARILEQQRHIERLREHLKEAEKGLRIDRSRIYAGSGSNGGGPNHVAADILRRAAGLGGHLVVAVIAPIDASAARPASGLPLPSASELTYLQEEALRVRDDDMSKPIQPSTVEKPAMSAQKQTAIT